MATRGDNSTAANATMPASDQELVLLVLQCIERHIADTKLAQRITAQTGVEREKISHLMVQSFGLSLEAMIIQERMRVAQRMLLESSASIAAIAQAVGYTSTSAFSTVFRKKLNMAPSEFRRTATLDSLISAGGIVHWG